MDPPRRPYLTRASPAGEDRNEVLRWPCRARSGHPRQTERASTRRPAVVAVASTRCGKTAPLGVPPITPYLASAALFPTWSHPRDGRVVQSVARAGHPSRRDGYGRGGRPALLDGLAIRRDFPSTIATRPRPSCSWTRVLVPKPRPARGMDDYYSPPPPTCPRRLRMARSPTPARGARETVARFFGAARSREVVFTKNAPKRSTCGAAGGGAHLRAGDAVLLTEMEPTPPGPV